MSDPIVDEIHKVREEYAQRFNYDMAAICRDLRERQAKSGRPVVKRSPKGPEKTASEFPAFDDPIVDEIHKIREAYLEKFDHDMNAIYRDLKDSEQQSGRLLVDRTRIESEQTRRPTDAA